jgi:hypothetical protein
VRPREIQRTVLDPERRELAGSRVEDAIYSIDAIRVRRGYPARLGDVRKPGTRLGSGSGFEVVAGAACRQNAGIGSKLIGKTTGGYFSRQQAPRRRRPLGDGPFWSGVAVFGVTFVGMQGFTCVRRRLRSTFVNDDSFIWATLLPDKAHHYVYYVYIGRK